MPHHITLAPAHIYIWYMVKSESHVRAVADRGVCVCSGLSLRLLACVTHRAGHHITDEVFVDVGPRP